LVQRPRRRDNISFLVQRGPIEGYLSATAQGTQPAGPLDVLRLAEFLPHTTKTGRSMHGILYLNLGQTSRLHTPRLKPIIPLNRPLPYERIARNYRANCAFEYLD